MLDRHQVPEGTAVGPAPFDPTALIARARTIVAGLEHRQATLVDLRVGLVSDDPEDVWLAHLLKAYGAQPAFLHPEPVSLSDSTCADRVGRLVATLKRQGSDLNLDALGDGQQIPTEVLHLDDSAHAQPFELLLVLGTRPGDEESALQRLQALAGRVAVNGVVELLDCNRGLLPGGVAPFVARAGRLGLGWRSATTDTSRMSFVRLAGPLHDFPAEDADDPQMLAHCRSRLEFVADLVTGLDVLEAGCATGAGARLFAAAGARRVVGLELLPELLDEARRRTTDPRIEYRQADLNRPLDCPDASFDLVVCTEVLEHITNHEGAVAEFLRVLRPGGRLVISVPDRALEDSWTEVNRFGNPYHLRVPTPADFARLLAPFAEVRHYRQLDVVGTLVVEDEQHRPVGEFVSDAGDVTGAVRSVRLAVCTRGPVSAAPPRPVGRLRLYRSFTDYQLQHHQHDMYERNHCVWARYHQWHQAHRERTELQRRMRAAFQDELRFTLQRQQEEYARELGRSRRSLQVEHTAALWRQSGGPLVLEKAIEPGGWLEALAAGLARTPIDLARSPTEPGAPVWAVRVAGPNEPPALTRVPNPDALEAVHSVLFPVSEDRVRFATLWHWRQRGAERLWFFEESGWRVLDAEACFARRLYRKTFGAVARRAVPWLVPVLRRAERRIMQWAATRMGRHDLPEQVCLPGGAPDYSAWHAWIAHDNEAAGAGAPVPGGRPFRVLLYVGALYSGGAERQMCNLAIGLKRRGVEVAVRTSYDATGDRGHYNHLLEEHGLAVRTAGKGLPVVSVPAEEDRLMAAVPLHLRPHVVALCAEIRTLRPDVLHCWLDEPNIIGAVAGLLAGVPRILLSMRNSNPTNFPRFYHPYMGEWYRLLAGSRRVHLLSNSRSGAASYAGWMGVAPERFHLVANGMFFDHFPAPTPEARRAARAALELSEGDRVVCGVFRLDEEKQPDVFLRAVQEVSRRVPELRVLLAGTGALARQIEATVKQNGMGRYLRLLGRCQDVGRVFLASDAMLLTSAFEGCPNAVIEAQYLGVPVVATRGGGTGDAILHGHTGYLTDIGDVARLAHHLTEVLANDDHRAALSEAAAVFARREFCLDQMADLTLLVYHRLFESAADAVRVITPLLARLEQQEGLGGTAERREAREKAGSGYAVRAQPPGPQPLAPSPSALPSAEVVSFVRRSKTPQAIMTPSPETEENNPELTADEVRRIEAVPGHFHLYDAAGLHRLARLATGPVVELGSYVGKSTLALLLGTARSGQRVHAVDPWFASDPDVLGFEHTRLLGTEDYLAFSRHVRPCRDRLSVLCCRGRAVRWDGPPIAALFIDAIHTYDEARADFHHYLPWLAPDARLAFHDYLPERTVFPGIRRFIEEELLASGEWWWDDFRGALLTLLRVRQPKGMVVEHNQCCVRAAQERIGAIARAQEGCARTG